MAHKKNNQSTNSTMLGKKITNIVQNRWTCSSCGQLAPKKLGNCFFISTLIYWLASDAFFYAKKYLNNGEAYLFYHLHFILLYFTPSFIKFETLYILHCLSVSLVQMSRGTRARVSKLWSPWVAGGRGRLGFTGWYVMPCRNGKVSRISRIQFYLWEWFVFWLKKNWKKETNQ